MFKNWSNKNKSHLKKQIGETAEQQKEALKVEFSNHKVGAFNTFIPAPRKKVFIQMEKLVHDSEDAIGNGDKNLCLLYLDALQKYVEIEKTKL